MCVEALAREEEQKQHSSTVQAVGASLGVYWQRLQMRMLVWLFSMQQRMQSEAPLTSRAIQDALKWGASFFAAGQKGGGAPAPENDRHRRAIRSRKPATT
jgi:hypothetical protein